MSRNRNAEVPALRHMARDGKKDAVDPILLRRDTYLVYYVGRYLGKPLGCPDV